VFRSLALQVTTQPFNRTNLTGCNLERSTVLSWWLALKGGPAAIWPSSPAAQSVREKLLTEIQG